MRYMHFAITLDTEVDKSRDWSVSIGPTYEGIHKGVKEILQPLFKSYGVSPVYFLSNEILADDDLSSVFSEFHINGSAELGTHLHFDAAGPLCSGEISGLKLDGIQAQLTKEEERLALTWLTQKYENQFNSKPVSFRAGRYGLGENSIGLLAELGYRIDSSVTPGLVWNYQIGQRVLTCDYRKAPTSPYECDSQNPATIGSSGILQIPITMQKSALSPKELLRLAMGRKRRWVWARPRFAKKNEFLKMIQQTAKRKNESDIIVMMFHNMEIIPGKSPYCTTQEDVNSYLDDLTFFIQQALKNGLTPITLKEYADKFQEADN